MTFRIPIELRARLERLAVAAGRSRDWHVNRALKRYLGEVDADVREILEGVRAVDAGDLVSGEEVGRMVREWQRAREGA